MIIDETDKIIKKFDEIKIDIKRETSIIKVKDEDENEKFKFYIRVILWKKNKKTDDDLDYYIGSYSAKATIMEKALYKALKMAYASYIFEEEYNDNIFTEEEE